MQLPSTFGKYELVEFLGGAASPVYRGRNTATGGAVVVKILDRESTAENKARFLDQARAAAHLRHENIASVVDYGEEEGRPFLVAAYVEGSLGDASGLTLLPSLRVAAQVAAALQYMHQRGVVHGAVNPESVRLDASGNVKLVLFGVTTPDGIWGDQAEESGGDIHAWGLLASGLLGGLDGVPPEIRALVLRAASEDVAQRPQNFGVIRGTLEGFLSKAPGETPAEPRPVRQPRPAGRPLFHLSVMVYGAVIVTTLATLGAWFWFVRPSLSGKAAAPSAIESYAKAMAEGMIDVPAGTFLSGADKHPVMLNEFLIDATEVTAGDFCDLMPCEKPPSDRDLPMVNITIAQARLYAMRVGKRLPTPLEWERAARGPNGNLYPWGNAQDPTLANVANNPSFGGRGLVNVKSFQAYKDGKAVPDGAYQMVGNAREFVEGRVMIDEQAVARFAKMGLLKPAPTASEPWVSVRGGSYEQPLTPDIVYDSFAIPERFSAPDIGFRCVRDPRGK